MAVPPGRLALPTNAQECLGEGLVMAFANCLGMFMNVLGMTRNV